MGVLGPGKGALAWPWWCRSLPQGTNVVRLPVCLPPQCCWYPLHPLLTTDAPTPPSCPYTPASGSAATVYWCPMWSTSHSTCNPQCPLHPYWSQQTPNTLYTPWHPSNTLWCLYTPPGPQCLLIPLAPAGPWAPTLPASLQCTPDTPYTPANSHIPWCPLHPYSQSSCQPNAPYTPYCSYIPYTPVGPWHPPDAPYTHASGSTGILDWGPLWLGSQFTFHLNAPTPLLAPDAPYMPCHTLTPPDAPTPCWPLILTPSASPQMPPSHCWPQCPLIHPNHPLALESLHSLLVVYCHQFAIDHLHEYGQFTIYCL